MGRAFLSGDFCFFEEHQLPPPHYSPPPNHNRTDDSSTFYVAASAFSLAQRKMVAHSKEALVWFTYDVGRKCDLGEEAKGVVAESTLI